MAASPPTGASPDPSGPTVPLALGVVATQTPVGKIVGVVLITDTGEQARFAITPPRRLPDGRQFRIDVIDGRAYLG